MTPRHAKELLYDSEAALRLVDSAIEDIREARPSDPNRVSTIRDQLTAAGPLGLIGPSELIARSYGEIVSVLGSLRQSRTVLQRAGVEQMHHTHERLREVTTATETAATDILNGLDRAVALVNDMDAKADTGDAKASAELRNQLRDELFSLMGCMQFQDITSQQLHYASSVLTEMEARLAELASILDPATFGSAAAQPAAPNGPPAFDSHASTENAAARQAVADEIFKRESR